MRRKNITEKTYHGNLPGKIIINLVLAIFSITCIFPAIWLFYSSMKTKSEFFENPIALPSTFHFGNYINVLQKSDMLLWMKNTARNTFLSLVLILLIGFVVGYFVARFDFKGRKLLYSYFLLGMLIPIHAIMIPMYILFTKTGLGDSWYTLIFPYTAFGIPISVFLVESYVRNVPRELEEAAAIDGSSFTRTLFSIILPVAKPILVTIAIIQVFSCWNEFSFALVLIKDVRLQTVPLAMTMFKGQFASDYPKIMSAMLTTMAPIVVLYFIFSKQIIKGMVAGAVKG